MSNKQAIEILDEMIEEYIKYWVTTDIEQYFRIQWAKFWIKKAKEKIQAITDDEWISVLEKLPDDSYWDVLCYCKELNDLWISYYTEILHYNCWMWMKNFIEYNVTHFRPLPTPPITK